MRHGKIKHPTGAEVDEYSIDGTLAGNSDTAIPTEKAVKTYADTKLTSALVNRGDPASVDFAVGVLTTDSSYHDLDLSSIVPEGAVAVLLHTEVRDDTLNWGYLRKKGDSNQVGNYFFQRQVANLSIVNDVTVFLDSNRVIEYKFEGGTWTKINLTVKGWFF